MFCTSELFNVQMLVDVQMCLNSKLYVTLILDLSTKLVQHRGPKLVTMLGMNVGKTIGDQH